MATLVERLRLKRDALQTIPLRLGVPFIKSVVLVTDDGTQTVAENVIVTKIRFDANAETTVGTISATDERYRLQLSATLIDTLKHLCRVYVDGVECIPGEMTEKLLHCELIIRTAYDEYLYP
jgi:hypothetical protein